MKNINNYLPDTDSVPLKKLQLLWRFAMVVLVLFIVNSSAIAQIAPVSPPTGGFDIDGNLRANLTNLNVGDWVAGPGGTGGFVFNNDGTVNGDLNAQLVRDPYNDRADIIFTEGSKFNANPGTWAWSVSKAPNKNDINNAMYLVTRDASNNDWIIIGGDRLSTSGTSYIDFELLQKPVTRNGTGNGFTTSGTEGGRTVGDLVVSMEYSNGGSKPIVRIYRWQEVSPGVYDYVLPTRDLSALVFAETNRTGAVDVPFLGFGSTSYAQYAFVEAAVNVTGVLRELADPCAGLSIRTIFIKTKASDSQTAALKDMVQPIPVTINFGSATIAYGGPYCPLGTASVTQTGVTGGTYSSTSGLSINATTGEINLATSTPGTYTVTYTYITNGCEKTTPATVVINANPAAPTLSPTQPTCTTPTGSVTVTAPVGTGLEYSLNGGTWQTGTTFSNLAAGSTYSVRVKNSTGCISSPSTGTLDSQPPTPAAPTAEVDQPTCTVATGTIRVTSSIEGLTFSINSTNPADFTNTTGVFGMLTPGSYIIRSKSGVCISDGVTKVVNSQPPTPLTPELSVTQPTCAVAAKITITSSTSGLKFSLDGGPYADYPAGGYTGLSAGSHSITAQNASLCVSPAATETINAIPNPPSAPTVTIVDASLCGPTTATVTVTCPLNTTAEPNRYAYSNNGGAYQASPVFGNLAAGSGFSITVKDNVTGCISSATTCNNYTTASCTQTASATIQTQSSVQSLKGTEAKPTDDQVTAYPIPFYDKTTIEFTLEKSGKYVINLYDMKGKLVRELKSGTTKAGETKSIEVDGRELAEGMYLTRIESASGTKTVKLLKRR
ncbi:T9SS type A sorting domain-containing protein [Pontibacter pudoricolor]|uniref:T9SS type A sorting domain-containing protein n=1 Tax=Pontibacter pudoricolor TaxID=2694930 RepID=UPI0013908463|nr:T9SS type A sorting domain-containing protein [Pontibacter pudoricolor]